MLPAREYKKVCDELKELKVSEAILSMYHGTEICPPVPQEFQRRLNEALEGLDGVRTIADGIIVFGVGGTDDEAVVDHDCKLLALLEHCCQDEQEQDEVQTTLVVMCWPCDFSRRVDA